MKTLEAVLLGIILGVSSVPTTTLAVERTGSKYSKYSAVEQTAAAAAGFAETERTVNERKIQGGPPCGKPPFYIN